MTRLPTVRRAIAASRGTASSLLIVAALLLGATVVRVALSPLSSLTYVTFYPAVLICTLLAGWRYGLVSALLTGVLAEVLFPSIPHTAFEADIGFSAFNFLVFLASCAIMIAAADALRRALRDLDRAAATAGVHNRELQHRVSNMLAVVQALALQSAKGASPETFVGVFSARLQALSAAHALLGKRNLDTCALPELVEEAVQPFITGENIAMAGPPCELPADSCVPLVLALHELCTNAVKHGALSSPLGRVAISWSLEGEPRQVVIDWRESGGPPVAKPTRKGLGSALLRKQPGIADAAVSFEKAGLWCRLTVDGAKAVAGDTPDGAASGALRK